MLNYFGVIEIGFILNLLKIRNVPKGKPIPSNDIEVFMSFSLVDKNNAQTAAEFELKTHKQLCVS